MKWFSLSGISKEVKRIHWPKASDMVRNTAIVVGFIFVFAIFFLGIETLVSVVLKWIGIGG